MKFINLLFSSKYNEKALNVWLLVIRLAIGFFMLSHGFVKFQLLTSGNEIVFVDPIGIGTKASFILIVFAEFFCSILLILGIFTRLATIPLIISMFVASFIFHANDPFSTKELSLIYLIIYIGILLTGSGKYSLDYIISKKIKSHN